MFKLFIPSANVWDIISNFRISGLGLCIFISCAIPNLLYGQTSEKLFEDWHSFTGVQEFHYKVKSLTDTQGNIYITGATLNDLGDYDILIAKSDGHGNELWSQIYNGDYDGNDYGTDLKIDSQGNVYVTGALQNGSNIENDYELILLKYNSSGTLLWDEVFG